MSLRPAGLTERIRLITTLNFKDMLEAKKLIEEEISWRQHHYEPIEFICPKCGFASEVYQHVHDHMIGFHRLGYKETVDTIERMFP